MLPMSMYIPNMDLIQRLIGADTRDSCGISVFGETPQKASACSGNQPSRKIRTQPISMYNPNFVLI
ncbi:hypothetical protein [Heyndrickxia acidicola]|uniref:Uncharacterized protein n=1 Tax=Heyndrickxia acidicola TaxID=209389 RepID=A0ABU6MDV3_9BACI|nr:hypothetical protein [Heyndrickxia acidicola]MED1202831.1 hypothetical protein [Heyndrickxia acidicola]